jgi:16S rRNA G1207 methylase RsmC
MRSTERFTGLADVYGQARPTYPTELVRWCLEQTSTLLIVDLGCGTGISTRLFASTGLACLPLANEPLAYWPLSL